MKLSCSKCLQIFEISLKVLGLCPDCKGLLKVEHLLQPAPKPQNKNSYSGVWAFQESVAPLPQEHITTLGEGNTPLYKDSRLNQYALGNFQVKHEGMNPTGSFKDRGMTVAVSVARSLGVKTLICASTGNTSASLAAYAAAAQLKAIVLLPEGKISKSKLAQAIGYGAECITIKGNFDTALEWVQKLSESQPICVVNSINPFRIEGQKTIIWEMLASMDWNPPDWILVPGGNLGNTSAFGAALNAAKAYGWIDKIPKIATIQAEGASPFATSYKTQFSSLEPVIPKTIASAIQIGNPVNFPRAVEAITTTRGVVTSISDEDILNAKSIIDRCGIGCEPASACTLAGARSLREAGIIDKKDSVVGILTGHILKDTEILMEKEQSHFVSSFEDLLKVVN